MPKSRFKLGCPHDRMGYHCVKNVQIWSYFWSAFSCIHYKYRKTWTRNNSVFGHFSRSDRLVSVLPLLIKVFGKVMHKQVPIYMEAFLINCYLVIYWTQLTQFPVWFTAAMVIVIQWDWVWWSNFNWFVKRLQLLFSWTREAFSFDRRNSYKIKFQKMNKTSKRCSLLIRP